MVIKPAIDVSKIPTFALDNRAMIWWGNLGMLVIEGTMFMICLATYFYLRLAVTHWPPAGFVSPSLVSGSVSMALMLLSVIPVYWADQAALRRDLPTVRRAMVLSMLLGLAVIVVRCFEFRETFVKWDSNAYGSVVWTAMGLHTVHLIAATLEGVVITTFLYFMPVFDKHYLDTRLDAIYWYFVVGIWIPFYITIYFAPRLI